MTSPSKLQLRVPAAVIRLALAGPRGIEQEAPAALSSRLLAHPGIFTTSSGFIAVAPAPGDEAVFDAAVAWIRDLEQAWAEVGATTEHGLSAVVLPGIVVLDGDEARLLDDFLLDDLKRQPPALGPGIFLTGRAAKMLEIPPRLGAAPEYDGPSGKGITLYRIGEARHDHLPWRNPEVFGHRTPFASRAQLEDGLGALLAEAVTRVSGPMGCGKSRLLWEHLTNERLPRLWLRVRPQRTPTPTLAEQVIRQLLLPSEMLEADPLHPKLSGSVDRARIGEALSARASEASEKFQALLDERALAILDHLGSGHEGPLVVVIDDYHLASARNENFISKLLASRHLGLVFKIVFIGRSGSPWPAELEPFPVLEVPPLSTEEMSELTVSITAGLSIPDSVMERFIHSVQGYPFAFEEGLFALIHERYLRRVYGSFFFGGDESTEFQPSHRFVRHVEAEVVRLGSPLPIRLLSLMETPVPASELSAAASILGEQVDPGWEHAFLESRILAKTESPWGTGLEIVSPVNASALSHGFTEEAAVSARGQLGELLALSGQSGEAHWRAYKLLAGTPEALDPLLQIFKTAYASNIPREELLDVLTKELRLAREREGQRHIQLELLWRLLPLARRMGRLGRYEEDLAHGIELAHDNPKRLLALAGIKAEIEQDAGQYSQAETTIQSALKAAADIDARKKALLMIQLGKLFLRQNRYPEAEQLFANLQRAFGESGSSGLAATCLFYLGNIALHTGRLEEAMKRHLEALEARREQKLAKAVGSSLTALGSVASAIGNYPQALEFYRDAQAVLEEEGQEADTAFALLGVARILSRIGDFTGASGPARRALTLREARDDNTGEAIARIAVARNYLDIGRSETALEEARKAHFQLSMASAEAPLAEADEVLGRVHLSQRRLEDARRRLESALSRYSAQEDVNSASLATATLIEICLAQEDSEGIRQFTAELKNTLKDAPPADLREVLHFRLYLGLEWLSSQGHKVGNPTSFLERAYRSVLKKAAHLDHETRQRYLHQVPDIRAIVEAATKLGLDERGRDAEGLSTPVEEPLSE